MKAVGLVTGVPLLDRVLAELPLSAQKKGARVATRRAAKHVLASGKKSVPRRTGTLYRNLTVRANKRSRAKSKRHNVGHMVTMRTRVTNRGKYYAAYLEYGTKERVGWTGHRGKIDAAKFDFMRKSLYSSKAAVRSIFVDELSKWVTQQASKGVVVHGEGGGSWDYHGDWIDIGD